MLFLAFPLWMQGQSAREEIGKNPALAAGKYYAYQAPEEKLTPAPAGYEPFYISMFARHGSRYLTKEKKYAAPLSLLLEADEEGVLTPDGKCVLKVVASLAQEAEGALWRVDSERSAAASGADRPDVPPLPGGVQ